MKKRQSIYKLLEQIKKQKGKPSNRLEEALTDLNDIVTAKGGYAYQCGVRKPTTAERDWARRSVKRGLRSAKVKRRAR